MTTPALRELLPPHPAQLGFLKSGAVFRRFVAGQGGGKTAAGVFEARRYAKRHAGAICIATEPTYPMVRDILVPEFDRQWEAAGEEDLVAWRATGTKYVLANGSEVWLRQCDKPNSLRGPSVAFVWMDEAAQSPHDSFRILTGRLRQTGYPHRFICTGTPRGRNWLHYAFSPGDRPDNAPPYLGDGELGDLFGPPETFRATSRDNPYLDKLTKAALDAAYAPGTRMHEQEVLGLETVFEGAIYDNFDEALHIGEPPDGTRFIRVRGAQDWGWANPGCLLVGGMDEAGTLWIVEEHYATHQQPEWWAARALEARDRWGMEAVFADPSDPTAAAKVNEKGMLCLPATNAVIPGITAVSTCLTTRRLVVSRQCPNLIRELLGYAWKTKREGGELVMLADQPEKVNDHAVDALRYLVMGWHTPLPVATTTRIVDEVIL